MLTLSIVALILAGLPALLYLRNTRIFLPPALPDGDRRFGPVSVLIPARNEERSIAAAIAAIQANQGVEFEVVVLDDHSEDATASIVRALASQDSRVRLESAPPLPAGWCGKQHACFSLSQHARFPNLVFLDADVRLAPDGLVRMANFLETSKAELVSAFPRQETGTLLERMVIPLIHFLLLGFLPIDRMRKSRQPGLGTGCGQLFVTRADVYAKMGGHGAVRTSLHDGITLPRAYRKAGYDTDICDGTDVAVCRMYRGAAELWYGLAKNAREGLGAPLLLPFSTALLFGGQVLPVILLAFAMRLTPLGLILTALATALAYGPRLDAAWRYRQSWLGAVLHPLGILVLLAIQWYANIRVWLGRPVGWKGRPHPSTQTIMTSQL